MKFKEFQEILPFIRKPSTYLGNEINSIKKNPSCVDLFVALCFPDLYEIGMSHFGIQILYHILNRHERIAAERVFSPGVDMEIYLRSSGLSAFSLESGRPLEKFDIIGFSLLYELNYTNILTLLDLSGIPFYSAQRDESHPILIAGGPCAFNPEPVADFFDAIVIGDGEEVIQRMCIDWLSANKNGNKPKKEEILSRWEQIKGVYIPSRFNADYDDMGIQHTTPVDKGAKTVSKAVVSTLKISDFPDRPVVPYGRPVHDRLRLEVARGCTRGCRFCQAGMIYRPVRERSVEDLMSLSKNAVVSTGYEDISLLSLSTGDYSAITELLQRIIKEYEQQRIAVSLPSFRAGTLGADEMALIREIRKTGFTIAPEAGSQRLRNVINKNLTEEDIVKTVSEAFSLGWNLVKLYFMVGLPTETDEDIEQIITLVRKLAKTKRSGGRGRSLNVSVAAFIPKPHTPFQWEPQIEVEDAKERIFAIKRAVESKKVGFKWQNPEVSLIEGLLSRGDRRLSRVIESAYRLGCRFDGWTDSFNFEAWRNAAASNSIDMGFYTARRRETTEPLAWDHIDSGVKKSYLLSERDRAYKGEQTLDCRVSCNDCGVCDFDSVSPVILSKGTIDGPGRRSRPKTADKNEVGNTITIELLYSKTGQARFFGHLEFANIITRAVRRAGIPVVFSRGFHPKPKISFSDPLPVGVESEEERLWMKVSAGVDLSAVTEELNRNLPEGIRFHGCRVVPKKGEKVKAGVGAVYEVRLDMAVFSGQKADKWLEGRPVDERERDIREVVEWIRVVDPRRLFLKKRTVPGKRVSIDEIISSVFGVDKDLVRSARVVKKGRIE